MTPVTIDMSYIHLGKDQGPSGRHQDCLQSLLELLQVASNKMTGRNMDRHENLTSIQRGICGNSPQPCCACADNTQKSTRQVTNTVQKVVKQTNLEVGKIKKISAGKVDKPASTWLTKLTDI